MIELCHITKEYPSKDGVILALDDVSLTVKDGEIYGIIGLSGAGKSTLVRCINLLERPTRGQVFIDGEELTAIGKKRLPEIRRNIGMIFQNFNLLEQRTAEGNVRFPLEIAGVNRKDAAERTKELLELVGLSDKAESYPAQLSGGQKQRIAIARALATKPKYLLCDEATSALDPATTDSILELLRRINSELGVTIVVITHEMRVVENVCDRVAVLDSSKIVEEGEVSEVFSYPKSEIAKQLIIPELIRSVKSSGGKKLRLVFNGETADSPVISRLAIECGIAVNILYADTKNIDGRAFGHMVIALPAEEAEGEKVKEFLLQHQVSFKEEI